MNKIIMAMIIVLAVLIGVLITSNIYINTRILKIDSIPMDITVGDHIGLNANNSALHFGMATPGGKSTRFMNFKNKYSFDVRVAFQTFGDMASWVKITNSSFVLVPNESSKVTFDAIIPENVSLGNYTGSVRIIFKKK